MWFIFGGKKIFMDLMLVGTSHRPREVAMAFPTTPYGSQAVRHCSWSSIIGSVTFVALSPGLQ